MDAPIRAPCCNLVRKSRAALCASSIDAKEFYYTQRRTSRGAEQPRRVGR